MRKRILTFWNAVFLGVALIVGVALGYSHYAPARNALAGAAVVGEKTGATDRLLISSGGDDRVKRIVYVKTGSHASAGANTPVTSTEYCGLAGVYHYAQVDFTGTLAGTNPTLTFTWENSKDNGATWTTIGSWTTVNATVTPASQKQTLADHGDIVLMNANTPVTTPAVVYGDCFRFKYTFAGTGNPAGNFVVTGLEK